MKNNSEQTSGNIDKDAWIICDSRSHPGLKFYVNKESGIKVWNITESEIALAEKFGKTSQEPDGSPKMNNPTDQTTNVNNQFSNQLSNLVLSATAGQPYPAWDMHQSPPLNLQQQLFNCQGQPVNLQQQLFTIVPTAALTPLINQAANLQNLHQLLSQSTSLHNNVPFVSQQQQYGQNQSTPMKRSFNSFKNRNKDRNKAQYNRQENQTNGSDLRMKLIRRRRSASECFSNSEVNIKNETNTTNETRNWNETVPVQLNLAPLKTFTATNSEANQWFIVVEKDIILENYTFLDDMVTADPDCHLVVPHHVMSELRTHVSVSSDVRPRRTLRFLTQQIENGMAILGEQEEGRDSSHKTILTCMKLASGNNVVILIANNEETLKSNPNIKGVHVFTMQAVKDILTKPKMRANSPTMAIKIVVPNNLKKDKDTCEPEKNITRGLFNHYGHNNQSCSKNLKLNTQPPPVTKDKMAPPTIAKPTKSTKPLSPIIARDPVTKKISPEKTQSTPDTNLSNSSKTDYKNPQIPAMTNVSSKDQGMSTHKTPNKNSPSSSKFDRTDPQKQASNVVAVQTSPKLTSMAVQCNNNAVDEEDEISRTSATYVAPTDPKNSNFHDTNATQKTSDAANKYSPTKPEFVIPNNSNLHHSAIQKIDSNTEANKYSPTKPEFASPRKNYNSNWIQTGKQNKRNTMDTSSTSSTSNISLDSISIKKIISMKKLVTATSKGQIVNTKECMPQTEYPKSPSSWSSYDNYNTSEPSLKKTFNANVVIEETSTSGVRSYSESSYSDKVINPKNRDVKKVSRRRNVVMYEVACQSMEDVLRLRSEEWVFRFVQIMEEVLRVKLQEKIPYEQKEPAPWNLQEAARCIIKKYDCHFDVVDAANKLSRFLYETSDQNGKIINIEPSDYMELYSYGVYLVETFLDMCADCQETDCRMKNNEKRVSFSEEKCSCHDVSTASELLKKLLFDIHNANVETFADHPPDFLMDSIGVDDCTQNDFNMETRNYCSTEVVKLKKDEIENTENVKRYPTKRKHDEDETDGLDESCPNLKRPTTLTNQQFTKEVETHPCKKNNLGNAAETDEIPHKIQTQVKAGKRFEKIFFNSLQLTKKIDNNKTINGLRKEADDKVPPKVRNITMGNSSDSAFFSSLQVDKKDLKNADKLKACKITVVCSNKADDPDVQKDPTRSSPDELAGLQCHFSDKDNLNKKSPSKVVCNFKINEDIERRVQAKRCLNEYENSEPEENLNGEYNEAQDYIRSVDTTSVIDGMTTNETSERIPANDLYERTTNGSHLSIENKVSENDKTIEEKAEAIFQGYIKNFSVRLANTFSLVISLCDAYCEERKKNRSSKCTEELKRKVKIAFLLLFRIHKNLKNANNRGNHYENNLMALLKLENIQDHLSDERLSSQYRQWIAKSAETVEEILKNVRGILSTEDESTPSIVY